MVTVTSLDCIPDLIQIQSAFEILMGLFSFFYVFISFVYLCFLFRLEEPWRDRLIIIILRAFLLSALGFLLLSPRFESVHKIWKDPLFLILEDDSVSTDLDNVSKASKAAKLESELAGRAKVIRDKFGDFGARETYSIQSNLSKALQIENLRGVFLITDGQEISKGGFSSYPKPIFPVPEGTETTRDYWVTLKEVPTKINLGQKVRIQGFVGRSDSSQNLGIQQVKVKINLGVGVQHEKLIQFAETQKLISFIQDLTFSQPGNMILSAKLEVQDQDTFELNNEVNYLVEVRKKLRKVVLISDELGMDKAFYLRILRKDPSLDVQSLYLGSKYPDSRKMSCEFLSGAELLILHTTADKFFKECIESNFDEIPRIHVIGSEELQSAKYQLKDFFSQSVAVRSRNSLTQGVYRLDASEFPALKLYEHDAYQKTLMSSLPEVTNFIQGAEPKLGIKIPFFIEAQDQKTPLLLVNDSAKPVRALFACSDLHRLSFAPWIRGEQRLFMTRLFQRLTSWLMDYSKLKDLNVFIPQTDLKQGQLFSMDLDGISPVSWELKGFDANSNFIRNGGVPTRFREILPVGNYSLRIHRGELDISEYSINVNYDPREFETLGINDDSLENLAKISDGKWINQNKTFDASELISELSGNLLQKKLELKRSQVDLQKNIWLGLFIMMLLTLEWVYRFFRKMI